MLGFNLLNYPRKTGIQLGFYASGTRLWVTNCKLDFAQHFYKVKKQLPDCFRRKDFATYFQRKPKISSSID